MYLFLFWIKTAVKRIIVFLKQSPILVAGTVVIIFSLVVAGVNTIVHLNTAKCITILSLFTIIALIVSLKQYNVMPVLLLYSKSNRTRKTIRLIFFVKKAFVNNMPLLLFDVIVIKGFIIVEQYIYFPLFTIFSILSSLMVMIVKNNNTNKGIGGIKVHKTHIGADIKTMLYDYITHDFFQNAAIAISLFVVFFMEAIKVKIALQHQDGQSNIFVVLASALSLWFPGIIDSIPHINWKYYAIVSPQNFLYHFRKTAFFLLYSFGLFIAAFIILGLFINTWLMLVNLYCITVVFVLSINIAFTFSNMVTKALLLVAAIIFSPWFSLWAVFTRFYFMLLLLVIILISLVKAKSEYREWYVL
jgi:hypothetical protein